MSETPEHDAIRDEAAPTRPPPSDGADLAGTVCDPSGRYQLLAEIGRGGMGAVYLGRDTELGRDLAVKILLEAHKDCPEVARRFIEEAQITGQLQHPAAVPVYGLGRLADGRPYIALKLVQGRTLAELLKKRGEPGALAPGGRDRLPQGADAPGSPVALPRLLKIFERVCQTIAYAHSKGVIHRDLKPQNVMVGEFGEVQVMDWGLAKVLAEGGAEAETLAGHADRVRLLGDADGAATQAGSVLGTPAYMPPEQAAGQKVDRRADVFGLGAILYEILTGKPPYTGAGGVLPIQQARRAELGKAFARLDGCGADAELVGLCKHCLAPEPSGRPADAAALAAEVAAYLAAIEERLHAAQLAQAAAQARALQERKTRRRTLALAATLMVAVVGGAITWGWLEQERLARLARTASEVNEAIGRAEQLRAQAVREPGAGPARWQEAREALRRAESALEAGEADEETRQRVDQLRAELDAGIQEAEADRAMLARLEKLWLEEASTDTLRPDHSELRDRAFARAFRDYLGVDLDQLDPEEAAARLRGRRIGSELAEWLDRWADTRATPKGRKDGSLKHLVAVARRSDPDPWRERMRAALLPGDMPALRQLAEQADVAHVPPRTLAFLAEQLVVVGLRGTPEDIQAGTSLLRRAQHQHPGHFELAFFLAWALALREPPDHKGAIRFFTTAVTLQPDNVPGHNLLGLALGYAGRHDEAVLVLRRGMALGPPSSMAYVGLGLAYEAKGDHDQAIASLREAVKAFPDTALLHAQLAFYLSARGEAEEAAAVLDKALRLDPRDATAWHNRGILQQKQGAHGDAVPCFRKAIAFYAPRPFGAPILGEAYSGLGKSLIALQKLDEAMQVYQEGIKRAPSDPDLHVNRGTLLFRLGREEEALAEYETAIRLDRKRVAAYMNKALIFKKAKNLSAAAAAYREAIAADPERALAHFQLALVLGQQGDTDGAVAELREAYRLDPKDALTLSRLGCVLSGQKRHEEAIKLLRQAVKLDPKLVEAHINLGTALGTAGKFADSVAPLRTAVHLDPNNAKAQANLGSALWDTWDYDGALAAFRRAVALDDGDAFNHFQLGHALQKFGRLREALHHFERAAALGPRQPKSSLPAAQRVAECKTLLKVDATLPSVLRGEIRLKGFQDKVFFARFCEEARKLYGSAVGLFEDAFRDRPALVEDLNSTYRFHAAIAATLAGCGHGEDAGKFGAAERQRWRQKARDWFQAELSALRQRLDAGGPAERRQVQLLVRIRQQELSWHRWLDPKTLAGLPDDERRAFREVWADLDSLLKQASEKEQP
jgi:serine/threonine-protein kinase